MAIFGLKKIKETKKIKADAKPVVFVEKKDNNHASVVIRPRITEKSGILSQSNVYTFEVTKNANKGSIMKAISTLYKVVPTKVAIINTPRRNVFVKGRKGTVAGIKKAVITLKKGDKIDFV
ncbi:MAG: 50S ribosomal protein L23 [Candidatus Paceibacterota bacterium]|jgi:large subunit ribosomal protein L23